MKIEDGKIFGIGLSKTGTTSLARALEMLGYKTKDYPGIKRFIAGDLESLDLKEIDMYEALTDTPIPSFYQELDERYPGSKFILTVRDQQEWLRSCKKQFTKAHAEKQNPANSALLNALYGSNIYNEERFAAGYRRFVDNVYEYFKARPSDLLVIDVTGGDGWEKLCPFLGRPAPDAPFPKANVTNITWIRIEDLLSLVSKAGESLVRCTNGAKRRNPLSNVVYEMRGGDAGMIKRAARKICRTIEDGLTTLSPNIPVVSRLSDNVSYTKRANWNHFWLVDPLDGSGSLRDGGGAFTINIALIQDGLPIYGIVHAPRLQLSYYSRLGNGAFKTEEGATIELVPGVSTTASNSKFERETKVPGGDRGSIALAICRAAERNVEVLKIEKLVYEYETAASQLVATNMGMTVSDCGLDNASGDDKLLTYNKKEMASYSLVVRLKRSIS